MGEYSLRVEGHLQLDIAVGVFDLKMSLRSVNGDDSVTRTGDIVFTVLGVAVDAIGPSADLFALVTVKQVSRLTLGTTTEGSPAFCPLSIVPACRSPQYDDAANFVVVDKLNDLVTLSEKCAQESVLPRVSLNAEEDMTSSRPRSSF